MCSCCAQVQSTVWCSCHITACNHPITHFLSHYCACSSCCCFSSSSSSSSCCSWQRSLLSQFCRPLFTNRPIRCVSRFFESFGAKNTILSEGLSDYRKNVPSSRVAWQDEGCAAGRLVFGLGTPGLALRIRSFGHDGSMLTSSRGSRFAIGCGWLQRVFWTMPRFNSGLSLAYAALCSLRILRFDFVFVMFLDHLSFSLPRWLIIVLKIGLR